MIKNKKTFGFPNHLISDEEKNKDDFGLSMGKAIEAEWFNSQGDSSSRYESRNAKYHQLRLYARGEQDTKIYKDLLGDNETYTTFDWRPLQIAPKFVNLIVNQMSERLFDVRAEAIDKYSTDAKDKHQKYMEDMINSKPIMDKALSSLGVDMFPQGYDDLPKTQEELELYMSLKYKPSIEIASEEALKYTLELNDYDEIQSRLIEDITTIGIAAIKHYTDASKGIVIEHVDPSDLVYSYPKHKNFKDVHYYGQVKQITINELKRLVGDKYTDDKLSEIAKKGYNWAQGKGNMNSIYDDDDIGGSSIYILDFTFKSTNTISYKKKFVSNGGFKMTKKESTFEKKDDTYTGYDAVKRIIDVWYEGTLILGTDELIKYELCSNMVRPKGLLNMVLPNYILYAPEMYQGRTNSLVGRIIMYIDEMQQIHIKIQQLIAKARPNGIYIDVHGLSEIDMGNGSFLTPLEVVKIYNETGNVIGSSVNEEGEYNYGKEPIRELNNGITAGISELINSYNHYLNQLRDAIGIPQGADASMPHPDTLVGVQQQVALNSNTATRHILDSVLRMTETLGEGLMLRLKDIFKYSNLKEAYMNAIGKNNIDKLESLNDFYLHDLSVMIELKPDAQEKQLLESNINMAISKDSITIDDGNEIRSIGNIKLANQLLRVRRNQREKSKREHEQKIAEINQQGTIRSTQMASESKQMEIKLKAETELMLIKAKSDADVNKLIAEKNAKSELMKQEFEYNMFLKGVDAESLYQREKSKEDRKDKRQLDIDTRASKMIQQKNTGSPAINFESSEDNISGNIEMSELEPS